MRSNRVGINYTNTWSFIKASLKFLMGNKDLFVCPLISLIALALGIGLATTVPIPSAVHWVQSAIAWLLIAFAVYFIIIFSNTAMVACICQRLQHQKSSVANGFKFATKRLPQILGWSLISAIIGTVLNALESSHNIFEEIIGALLSFAWSLTAFFVVPIIVVNGVGPIKAIKESAKIFARNFRTTIKPRIFIGFIIFILFALCYGILAVLPNNAFQPYFIMSFLIIASFLVIFNYVLSNIISSTLYLNFTDKIVPEHFNQEMFDNAMVQRKQNRLNNLLNR
jgi:hypothetical protein